MPPQWVSLKVCRNSKNNLIYYRIDTENAKEENGKSNKVIEVSTLDSVRWSQSRVMLEPILY